MNAELSCKKCGQQISQAVSERTSGLCFRCYKVASAGRETLQLLCMGCGRKYMLGLDAILTTPEDVISKVGGWLGGSPSAALYPDVIGPLGKPTPLDDKQPAQEREAIRALQEAIRVGTSRMWRYFECSHVQRYAPIPTWR